MKLICTIIAAAFLLAGCGEARDKVRALAEQEGAALADDILHDADTAYCKLPTLGALTRRCGSDLSSECWQLRMAACNEAAAHSP